MSQWSHNFRPAYLKLGTMLRERLRVTSVLALTATATLSTQKSIMEVLQIPQDGLRVQAPIRENLHLSVSHEATQANVLNHLLPLLKSTQFKAMRSIIVYVAFKWQATELATTLVEHGLAAAPYHAGLATWERNKVYERFVANKLRIVVATVAFGMGIDKNDVSTPLGLGVRG